MIKRADFFVNGKKVSQEVFWGIVEKSRGKLTQQRKNIAGLFLPDIFYFEEVKK